MATVAARRNRSIMSSNLLLDLLPSCPDEGLEFGIIKD